MTTINRRPAISDMHRREVHSSTAPPGRRVGASVNGYNPDKGFGFVKLADGSGDAFLHVSVLESAAMVLYHRVRHLRFASERGRKDRR